MKITVVGGGVIGCATAYELAKAGCAVTLFERATPGAEASGAAAGLLTPLGESTDSAYDRLALESWRLYPTVVDELRARTSVDVEYVTRGTIHPLFDAEDVRQAEARVAGRALAEFGIEAWDTADVRVREPSLTTRVRGAMFVGAEHWVNNQRLVVAYAQAAVAGRGAPRRHVGEPRHRGRRTHARRGRGRRSLGSRCRAARRGRVDGRAGGVVRRAAACGAGARPDDRARSRAVRAHPCCARRRRLPGAAALGRAAHWRHRGARRLPALRHGRGHLDDAGGRHRARAVARPVADHADVVRLPAVGTGQHADSRPVARRRRPVGGDRAFPQRHSPRADHRATHGRVETSGAPGLEVEAFAPERFLTWDRSTS